MKSSTTGSVEFVSRVWIVQHVLSVCFRRKLSGPLKLLSDSVDWRPTSDGVTLINFGRSKIEFNLVLRMKTSTLIGLGLSFHFFRWLISSGFPFFAV